MRSGNAIGMYSSAQWGETPTIYSNSVSLAYLDDDDKTLKKVWAI